MNKKVSFAHFQNWTGNRPFWLKAVILGEYVLWEHSIWEFSRRSTNVAECRAAMLVSCEVVRRGWLHRGCFKQESCIPPVTGKKKSLNIASQSGDLWLSWLLIASLVGSSTVETMKSIRIISLLPIHQIFFCASLRWKSGCIPKTATILSHIYFSFTIVCVCVRHFSVMQCCAPFRSHRYKCALNTDLQLPPRRCQIVTSVYHGKMGIFLLWMPQTRHPACNSGCSCESHWLYMETPHTYSAKP